jgi:hypothetical protein
MDSADGGEGGGGEVELDDLPQEAGGDAEKPDVFWGDEQADAAEEDEDK